MKYFRLIVFSLLFTTILLGQSEEYDSEKDGPVLETSGLGTRSRLRNFSLGKTSEDSQGNDRYFRYTVHDGNLVTGGVSNSGLLSYHYVSGCPRFSWPKGSQVVEYIHGAVFYVAAEVIDANGDTIAIVSDNYRRSSSEMSNDYSHLYGFMPLGKYFNMDQPEATNTPEIYGISEDVGEDGLPNSGDDGEGDGILQSAEDFNDNGELDVSMQNEVGWFAINDMRETWPQYWPAGSYPGDTRSEGDETPGVRAGFWNGEYGAYARADQESYYVMDDRENDEYDYYPFDDYTSWPDCRRGLGVQVESRNYQWSSRLAEDIFISVYDITDKGKELDKCIVGMYVDPDMGGSTSGDDADFDNAEDITYAWNKNFRATSGLEMGYFGFAFLESPGLANDGIDNDSDGMTDESQNNGIDDDGDWTAWEDENGNGVWDNEDTNHNYTLDDGEDLNGNGILDIEPLNDDLGSDGLGPNYDEYVGPDADGTQANGIPDEGESNFESTDNDESDQVGLTSWYLRDCDNTMAADQDYWDIEIQPNTYQIRAGYERDIAWTYGSGFVQFVGDEMTHRYAISLLFGNDEEDIRRNKKTMQVIYDNDYNFAAAPRQPIVAATADSNCVYLAWDKRAEYSNDPIYGQDFEAYYIYKATEPTFTEIKTITDAFGNPLLFETTAIYDLDDGLKGVHPIPIGSEIDNDSNLGISYNMGTDSGLKHFYEDTDVTNGYTYYYAIVSLDKGYDESFYPDITDLEGLQDISPTECSANIQIDQLGRAESYGINTVGVTPQERPAGWIDAEIETDQIEHVSGCGTGSLGLSIYSPRDIEDGTRFRLVFGDDGCYEALDSTYFTGQTNMMSLFSIVDGDTTALLSVSDPETNDEAQEFISGGIQVKLYNDTLGIKSAEWLTGNSTLRLEDITLSLAGKPVMRDYEIRVSEVGADTSVFKRETNFQIWDVTDEEDQFQVDFFYIQATGDNQSMLKSGDRIILVNNATNKKQTWKWDFYVPDSLEEVLPENGDVFSIQSRKPFDRNDAIEFVVSGNYTEEKKEKKDLDNIYVVPDPYVAVSSYERLVTNEDEGRGSRRVDFVNLPQKCTITIFTASGKLVRKLKHSSSSDYESRESWDLRTKDGLEIAFGVYFYAVETPTGGKILGKFSVIK